jgi:predicted esterase YcpF (UPF0227 family)
MKILYLHGFCARLNGRKASCLRSHFGETAVIEPTEPGFPYGRTITKPVLEKLAAQFKSDPLALLGLFGPGRMSELNRLSPELTDFFSRSVTIAQKLFDEARPDIIVGSSLGGSVAMAIESRDTPMVLVGPVWNRSISPAISLDNMPVTGFVTRQVLSLATSALRSPVARFAGFTAPRSIRPRTIILHSAHDRVFDLTNSRQLLRNSPIATGDPCKPGMDRVVDGLVAAGYAIRKCDHNGSYNDGRLIVIGKDHHTNEPDPLDRQNKDPHPHNAMIAAVRLLAEQFGAGCSSSSGR